ncbi:MAG: phosphoesterase RecJ domain-containing protein [Ruminiclostridium sp.]|jgi:phosphoesterase RecJ-like protein|nr:phosphoesterase RecJ domain-containing protein [Ruminiclostridium sp.]
MTEREAAALLGGLEDVLILTHRRPDGDTIGCAVALCLALRQLGKASYVLPNEDAHHLFDPYFEGVLAPAGFVPKQVVSVDTASLGMLPKSAKPYQGKIILALDHHGSNEGYAQNNCVDPSCAACGELLFRIFGLLNVSITPEIALPLYMAIATDTGCFVYSNTTPQTHRIAAALMESGCDTQWVNKRHFRIKSRTRILVESRLVEEMDLEEEGTLAFAYVTQALVQDLKATEEDLDDISSFIGLLSGVVNAVTLKELPKGGCKVSLRTDGKSLNASAVCARFGGGGHPAAAGCMIPGSPKEVHDALMEAIQAVRHG